MSFVKKQVARSISTRMLYTINFVSFATFLITLIKNLIKMFQETFEIEVTHGKRLPRRARDEEEDEGSEIEDDVIETSDIDEDEEEILDYLQKAFSEVADVTRIGTNEYMLDFYEPNAKLIEEEGDYDFETVDDVPVLYEPEYFIPFVEHIKNDEPALTGATLNTNLEGGGHLVI
jgi:hypothetical protein